MSRTIAVRYRAGLVGESQRQVHLCTLDDDEATGHGELPEHWATHCGLRIPDTVAETADRPAGMPCLPCLMLTASPREAATSIVPGLSHDSDAPDRPAE
ncbi:hypothetical protein SAMN04487904_11153 [Actinopolyspora lacussalsi subsp. righensis]|uniref:Uncharacterized protein n=1 Tax=Actinopolyspora righensis TaxID=995060 RepID=A0A1I7BH00_9ACTN|nr:hypothetical protein [Actinopolyspora righensis]SFT86476.1 hypothetical protein SAMN04487904_11153 [Actinopolyspora righensis]